MIGLAREDGSLAVGDPADAGTVYGRGYFGTVGPDGLLLDPYEAVYLTEMGRIEAADPGGRSLDWSTLFRRASRAAAEFGVQYVVYRDLRQRGYVVRASPPPVAFAVLPRGGVLHKTPSKYWVQPFSEREPFRLAELRELASRAQTARKNLLFAVVDEESDLTYYRVRRPRPEGALDDGLPSARVEGWLSSDRVVLFDKAAAESLGGTLAFGSRIGERLELSLLEAAYLAELGTLSVRDVRTRRAVPLAQLLRRGHRADAAFQNRLSAYRALRARRLIVKTGFKYGAHFRAYVRSPDRTHARYLVQAVPSNYESSWPELAGSIRVAQGVRKEFLLASVAPGGVEYLSLDRVRP